MRRKELLGLRWTVFDTHHGCLSVNRGLIAIGYELHETRGKTRNSRRCIDLGPSHRPAPKRTRDTGPHSTRDT